MEDQELQCESSLSHAPIRDLETLDLEATADLLQRHHHANCSIRHYSPPTSREWHSLWGKLEEIREGASKGDLECVQWLAMHGDMAHAVEACFGHDVREAVTFRVSKG